jgi:hypothetical protein
MDDIVFRNGRAMSIDAYDTAVVRNTTFENAASKRQMRS